MGSHNVNCHPAQANTPRLNPSQLRLVLDLPIRRDGSLSWPRWLVTCRDGLPAHRRSVTHPSTNRARRRVTTLIETNVLPLSQATTWGCADDPLRPRGSRGRKKWS